jgi:hypothetical protein
MDAKVLSKLFHTNKEGKSFQNSWELSQEFKIDHLEMVGVLKSLDARGYIKLTKLTECKFNLTKEGNELDLI